MDWQIQLRQLARSTLYVALATVIHAASVQEQELNRPGAPAVQPQPIAAPLRAGLSDFDNTTTFLRGTSLHVVGSASGATATDVGAVDTLRPVEPDLRQPRDRNAVNGPPTGHNPQAFQIERVEPIQNRRTCQFFLRPK